MIVDQRFAPRSFNTSLLSESANHDCDKQNDYVQILLRSFSGWRRSTANAQTTPLNYSIRLRDEDAMPSRRQEIHLLIKAASPLLTAVSAHQMAPAVLLPAGFAMLGTEWSLLSVADCLDAVG